MRTSRVRARVASRCMPTWLQIAVANGAFFGVAYTATRVVAASTLAVLLVLGFVALAALLIWQASGSDAASWAALTLTLVLVAGWAGLRMSGWTRDR